MPRLRDVMNPAVVTLGPDMSIQEAAALLEKHELTGAPVLRAGRVVGVLSTSDLRTVLAEGEPEHREPTLGQLSPAMPADLPPVRRVKDVMTKRLIALGPDAELSEAAALMSREGVHRVLVMEGSALHGIVSALDIARTVGAAYLHGWTPPPLSALGARALSDTT